MATFTNAKITDSDVISSRFFFQFFKIFFFAISLESSLYYFLKEKVVIDIDPAKDLPRSLFTIFWKFMLFEVIWRPAVKLFR